MRVKLSNISGQVRKETRKNDYSYLNTVGFTRSL